MRRKLILAPLTILAIVGLFAFYRAGQTLWYLSDRRPFPATVSRETTYLTEPLREDGSVDYLAVINKKLGEGATPENNAAVLLWQALGPAEVDQPRRAAYFARLGTDPPPEQPASREGQYFVPIDQFSARPREIAVGQPLVDPTADVEGASSTKQPGLAGQLDEAMARPWTSEEFPALAEWLTLNEAALKLVSEASKRAKYFDSRVAPQGEALELLSAGHVLTSGVRAVAQALAARSMLSESQGNVECACQDAQAIQRLASLVAQSPTLIEQLVAIGVFELGCGVDRTIVAHGRLDARQLARFRTELEQLSPPNGMVDALGLSQRLETLDSITGVARTARNGGLTALVGDRGNQMGSLLGRLWSIDWDVVLVRANELWDQQDEALTRSTRAERLAALDQWVATFEQRIVDHSGARAKVLTFLGSRDEITERVANLLLAILLPASQHAMDAETRANFQLELTQLAAALEAYRLDQGRYPATLEALVPKYVKAIPPDMYGEVPLKYLATADGYELRSVGRDEKLEEPPEIGDDGTVYPDQFNDDLVIRAGEPVKMELPAREPSVPQ